MSDSIGPRGLCIRQARLLHRAVTSILVNVNQNGETGVKFHWYQRIVSAGKLLTLVRRVISQLFRTEHRPKEKLALRKLLSYPRGDVQIEGLA